MGVCCLPVCRHVLLCTQVHGWREDNFATLHYESSIIFFVLIQVLSLACISPSHLGWVTLRMPLPPWCLDYECMPSYLFYCFLYIGSGDQTQALRLAKQTSWDWPISLASQISSEMKSLWCLSPQRNKLQITFSGWQDDNEP